MSASSEYDYNTIMKSAIYNRGVSKDIIAYIGQAAIDNGVSINYMSILEVDITARYAYGATYLLELGYITTADISHSILSASNNGDTDAVRAWKDRIPCFDTIALSLVDECANTDSIELLIGVVYNIC
jgi:hypothetical protein